MDLNVKVVNHYPILIHLNFKDVTNRVVTLLPKSFAMISKDELMYLSSTSKILSSGTISIEGEGADAPEARAQHKKENVFNAKRKKELLGMSISEVKKAIESTTNILGLQELKEEAVQAEKPKGYVEAIEARIEALV